MVSVGLGSAGHEGGLKGKVDSVPRAPGGSWGSPSRPGGERSGSLLLVEAVHPPDVEQPQRSEVSSRVVSRKFTGDTVQREPALGQHRLVHAR